MPGSHKAAEATPPREMNKAWIGAFWLKTDIELMLKSRRVVPAKLLDAGFEFEYPSWQKACPHLVERWRNGEVLAA